MIPGVPSKFGSKVIGAEAAAAAAETITSRRTKFGPRVLGTKVVPGTNTPAEGSQEVTASMSVEKMGEVLKENPTFVVAFAEAEFRRLRKGPGTGPRKGALHLFLQHFEAGTTAEQAETWTKRCEHFLDKGKDEELETLEKEDAAAEKRARTSLREARTGR